MISAATVGVIALVVMIVLMMMQIPIAISMALPAIVGILYLKGWTTLSAAIETIFWNRSFHYTLSTLPMFILMGEMLNISGVSSELFASFRAWLGRLKGGLGIATIGASAIFAAASGSSVANTGTIGMMATKEMLKYGYSRPLASGSIVAGGTLGILIPPSSFLIFYGMLTEQSIGKLLIAGIIPGVLLALAYMLTVYLWVIFKPEQAPPAVGGTLKEKLAAFKSTGWIILLFIIVIGGMFVGVFGPTEAAGIGAFCTMLIALGKRKLTWSNFVQILARTVQTTGYMFAIVLGAFLLNYLLTFSKVPMIVSNWLLDLNLPNALTFFLILVMYFLLGALMDSMAALVVTIPIVMPIITGMGHDLIWYGIVMCMMVEAALISPPHGMNLLILNGVAPELKMEQIFKGALVFLIPIFLMIFIIYLFPELALYLPSRMS